MDAASARRGASAKRLPPLKPQLQPQDAATLPWQWAPFHGDTADGEAVQALAEVLQQLIEQPLALGHGAAAALRLHAPTAAALRRHPYLQHLARRAHAALTSAGLAIPDEVALLAVSPSPALASDAPRAQTVPKEWIQPPTTLPAARALPDTPALRKLKQNPPRHDAPRQGADARARSAQPASPRFLRPLRRPSIPALASPALFEPDAVLAPRSPSASAPSAHPHTQTFSEPASDSRNPSRLDQDAALAVLATHNAEDAPVFYFNHQLVRGERLPYELVSVLPKDADPECHVILSANGKMPMPVHPGRDTPPLHLRPAALSLCA
jgi:hypothetical protein